MKRGSRGAGVRVGGQGPALHDDLGPAARVPCTARRTPGTWITTATSATPGSSPTPAASTPTMYRGQLWTMRQFAGFGTRRGHERSLPVPARAAGRPGCPPPSTCRPSWGATRDDPLLAGEVGQAASPIAPCGHGDAVPGHPPRPVTTSMTINAPGRDASRDVPRRGREAGRRLRTSSAARSRTTSSRSSSPRRSGSIRPGRACGSWWT